MSTVRRRGVGSNNWGVPDRDHDGRPICRWCRTLVRPPRRTFCGEACVHEWRVRSDPAYVRNQVWKRDRGICAGCRADVAAARRRWRREKPRATERAARRAWRRHEPRWEADHIVPVADGGGECGLDNYRLLCRACHVRVTVTWRRQRQAAARVA
jgi:5-methylcytosine-specific restriction protein A